MREASRSSQVPIVPLLSLTSVISLTDLTETQPRSAISPPTDPPANSKLPLDPLEVAFDKLQPEL